MEKLLEVLEDVKPDVDFKSSKCLIDDRILDSLDCIDCECFKRRV